MKKAFWATNHKCYIGLNYFQCECGHVSVGIFNHIEHVASHNDNDLSSRNFPKDVYIKEYKQEEYEKELKKVRELRKNNRKTP